MPLVAALAGDDVLVSVDTYKPEVAEAAIEAGAGMINDVSGLRDPALAEVCARTGAALVLMHTRVAPKGTLLSTRTPTTDVVADVVGVPARADGGRARGAASRRSRSCSTRGRTSPRRRPRRSRCCGGSTRCAALGRPLLLAVSRKDFIGAITGRGPRERGAGTLAAIEAGVAAGASILRVHDVAAAADFLAVRAVLSGERVLAPEEGLTPDRYP